LYHFSRGLYTTDRLSEPLEQHVEGRQIHDNEEVDMALRELF
jgi:hypothetical protein